MTGTGPSGKSGQAPSGGAGKPSLEQRPPEWRDLARLARRLARGAVAAARVDELPSLERSLGDHLGPGATELPVVGDLWPTYDHANVQLALDSWLGSGERRHTLVGITGFEFRPTFSMADLFARRRGGFGDLRTGSVALSQLPIGPGGVTRACVRCGLYLVDDPQGPVALLLQEGGRHGPREGLRVEVCCREVERAGAVLAEIRRRALELSVFRGQVIRFGGEMFGPTGVLLNFHDRPSVAREGLVLPPAALAAIERHLLGIARHREELRASGQHLRRGLLLYGPPGTGKTHTVRYLLGRAPESTAIILSGNALGMIHQACSVARALPPAIVVIEDVDLIAEERGSHPGGHPLLFELLNEMDGLNEDLDIAFILTTNRADILEPALAARPGRVDEAVLLPLPDAESRLRLLHLYRGALTLELADADRLISRTEGVTASFLKELLRRSALMAAEEAAPSAHGPLTVTDRHLHAALDQLLEQQHRLTRALLGSGGPTAETRRGPRQSAARDPTPRPTA